MDYVYMQIIKKSETPSRDLPYICIFLRLYIGTYVQSFPSYSRQFSLNRAIWPTASTIINNFNCVT